jgi:hypothetical protein
MSRGLARSAVVVVALLALAATLTSCSSASPAPGRTVTDGPHRSTPLAIGISYGDTLSYATPAALDRALADANFAGAKWIRADLAWNDVESQQGVYNWSGFDKVVAAARAHGLSVLALLDYTPEFARRPECAGNPKCPPSRLSAFATFAADAVRRYRSMGVHTWEIWNEPNSGRFWAPYPQPRVYAQLVRLTAGAIRSQQPAATIILGSLAAGATVSYVTPARQFLADLCNLGVNRVVDAIGWHPYSFPLLPNSTDPHNPWNFISADTANFEETLAKAGTPNMPVWITEYGAPTGGPGAPATGPQHPRGVFRRYVTDTFQAELARNAVATADANPHVAAFFWFTDEDLPQGGDNPAAHFGLRRSDGSPKPALGVLRQAVAAISFRF